MSVQTVLGPIKPKDMGYTLTHEHLSSDLRFLLVPPKNEANGIEDCPWTFDNLGYIQQFPYSHNSNLILNDTDGEIAVLDSVKKFRNCGGNCILDNSSQGWNRNSSFLKTLSKATGVNIIAGTGFYTEKSHSEDIIMNATVEGMTKHLTDEITKGCCDDVSVKCGFIGEIGVSDQMKGIEKKAVQAAANAQQVTGAAVQFHPGKNQESPFEIMRVFQEEGGRADKAILCHTERTFDSLDSLSDFSKIGTYIQFDLFGTEASFDTRKPNWTRPNDSQRMNMILHLVKEEKYGEKILVSQDIHTKHRLEKFGGHGYKYVMKYVRDRMLLKGITDIDVHKFFVDNPATVLPLKLY